MTYGTRVYIAGPMRGQPCYNFEEFFHWARMLRISGYEVTNPAQLDCMRMLSGWTFKDDEETYEEILAADLEIITARIDWIFALKGSDESPGAQREIALAEELGLPVYYEAKETA